jgi:hypothetical protein
MNQLKGFLKLPEDQRKNVITKGVPLDSTNKQLIDWVPVLRLTQNTNWLLKVM